MSEFNQLLSPLNCSSHALLQTARADCPSAAISLRPPPASRTRLSKTCPSSVSHSSSLLAPSSSVSASALPVDDDLCAVSRGMYRCHDDGTRCEKSPPVAEARDGRRSITEEIPNRPRRFEARERVRRMVRARTICIGRRWVDYLL